MTQPELFNFHQAGNLLMAEPATTSRLAHGQENIRASSSRPPMPAPASSLPPFAAGSETSREAAIRILRSSETTKNEAALSQWMEFRGRDGATDDEIKEHFGWDGDYERPRRWKLCKLGLIFKSEMKRKTKDGNPATVWVRTL